MAQGTTMAAGLGAGYQALDQILAGRIAAQREQEAAMAAAQQQAIENARAEQEMELRQREFGLRQSQAEKPTSRGPYVVGGNLVSDQGGVLFSAPKDAPATNERPMVVGGNLVSPSGQVLFTAPKDTPKPDKSMADTLAEYEAKKKIDAKYAAPPRTDTSTAYATERSRRSVESVDDLLKDVGVTTTGVGSLTGLIPGTPARDFAGKLKTLKANIAFNELQQMRNASRTGGALGQVSDRELGLLESSLGALDQGMRTETLIDELHKIKASLQRWQAAQGGAPGDSPAVPETPRRRRYNPATGKIE